MLPLPAVTEPAKSILEAIRLHEAARSIIVQAERCAAQEDYPNAIENFGRVPKTETALYAQAQARIEECRALFRTQTAEKANLAYAEGDYQTAVLTLNDALQTLSDDRELTELLNAILTSERTSLRRDLLLEAGTLYGKGDYSGAFSKLYDLPEPLSGDELLASAAANYRQKYLRELPYTVNDMLQNGDFSAAEACVNETEILFPDAEALPELRSLIAGYQPQKLSALEISDFSDFAAAESALTDISGNVYDANGNLYCSYDGDASGRQSSSGTFLTNGQYNRLTLTAAPLSGFDPSRTVFLEICADGKKLEHYTFTAETGVLHIRLDISGAKKITFRILPAGTDDLRNTALLLADGTVSKV
jgi:hypothetical protein